MVMPGERIVEEESEDSEGTAIASVGDIGGPSDTASKRETGELSPSILSSDSGILSPGIPPPSPAHTRSHGKAKKDEG